MIWSGEKLRQWAVDNVTPFEPDNVNVASIDLRIGKYYRIPTPSGWSEPLEILEGGLQLSSQDFVLLHTLEFITFPLTACGKLFLKSSAGRRGLEHAHAGYIDCGFRGELTLEMTNHWPYGNVIHYGDRLLQVTLEDVSEPVDYSLRGHYQDQRGPTPSWKKENYENK